MDESNGTPENEAIQGFVEQEEKVRKEKLVLIDKLEGSREISTQYAKLLREISSETTGVEGANMQKVKTVLALGRQLKEKFRNQTVAYIGSGIDWHFPVAMGARRIDMVDLQYSREGGLDRLMQSIKSFDIKTESSFIHENNQIKFNIDLGDGEEEVEIRVFTDASDYHPESLGGVIEMLGPTSTYTKDSPVLPNVAAGLKEGAVIFNSDFGVSERSNELGLEQKGSENFTYYQVVNKGQLEDVAKSSYRKPLSIQDLRMMLDNAKEVDLENLT